MTLFLLTFIVSLQDATHTEIIEHSSMDQFYKSCMAFAVNIEDCKKN